MASLVMSYAPVNDVIPSINKTARLIRPEQLKNEVIIGWDLLPIKCQAIILCCAN